MKHTPGPWRWEVNERGKRIQLCGGERRWDLTVMDFARWGMQGATPRFIEENNPGFQILRPAIEYAKVVEGREHHSNWFKTIDNPDAKLIAAAPDLLDALIKSIEIIKQWHGEEAFDIYLNHSPEMKPIREALKKANV